MIRVHKYPHMGIAHLFSNDWELLFVLSKRGHTNGNASYWVRLDLVDSIVAGRTSAVNLYVSNIHPFLLQKHGAFDTLVLTKKTF